MLQKFKSIKTWVLIWVLFIITWIVAANRSDFVQLTHILAAVVPVYIVGNVAQKKIFADKDKSKEARV